MKRIYISYTFLNTIEVPDDWTRIDVENMINAKSAKDIAYEAVLNDVEWDWADE